MPRINILDTTLRDGEQTRGVSFTPAEKLHLAQELLSKLGVDRIEVASCKVGGTEQESVTTIMSWAKEHGHQDAVEVLSFVDNGESLDWLRPTGCKRINLLTKGSYAHCKHQLRKDPKEHFKEIATAIAAARSEGISVSVYLEDWSRGMQEEGDYVRDMLAFLDKQDVERVLLCDTLGVLSPKQSGEFVGWCCREFPDSDFEFHAHDDYGLATANVLAGVEAGASGVHVTINGLGERTGNASLSEVVVAMRDFDVGLTGVDETQLMPLARLCEIYTQKVVSDNTPIVGRNCFTHVSGIHVDGQEKANLYESRLSPGRFGREWEYGLGKLSGRKALEAHLKSIDSHDLSIEEQRRVLDKIRLMHDSQKDITQDDLVRVVKELRT